MSTTKDLFDEKQEERKNRIIATEIGISYDELIETVSHTFEITNDDGYVMDYVIEFSEDTSKDILKKIKNLNWDTFQCSILFIVDKLNDYNERDDDKLNFDYGRNDSVNNEDNNLIDLL